MGKMTPDPVPVSAQTNRNALVGFGAGLLTILALCTAVAPIPLTGYVCFPAAAVLAIVAVVNGFRARQQIRAIGGKGEALATASLAMGGAALFVALCSGVVTVALGFRIVDVVRQWMP